MLNRLRSLSPSRFSPGSRAVLVALPILLLLPSIARSECEGSNPLEPALCRRPVLVGPTFGVHRNYHSGGFRTIDEAVCPLFNDGVGWGFFAGLTAEFNPLVNGSWGVIGRVMYEQRPGRFEQKLEDVPVILPGTNQTVAQRVTAISDVTYSLLTAEVMYRQDMLQVGDVYVAAVAGPQVNYVLSGTNYQAQDLIEPTNARFIDDTYPTTHGGRRLVFYDGEIPALAPIRIALKGGVQGEIGLFNHAWMMTGGIYYDYGLTPVSNQTKGWSLNSIVFQIDLRRGL